MGKYTDLEKRMLNKKCQECIRNDEFDELQELITNDIDDIDDVDELALIASEQGKLNIVTLLFTPKNLNGGGAKNYFKCVREACIKGHLDIVKFIVEKETTDLNIGSCIERCTQFGHTEIIEYLYTRGEHSVDAANRALQMACRIGDVNLAKIHIDNGANDFDLGLEVAIDSNKLNAIKLMIDSGASNDKINKLLKFSTNADTKSFIKNKLKEKEKEKEEEGKNK